MGQGGFQVIIKKKKHVLAETSFNPLKEGITQSMLCSYLKCRRAASLGLQGWTPLKTASVLQFGEMAHGVLENIYKEGRKKAPSEEEVLEFIKEQVEAWETSPRGQRAGAEDLEQLELNTAFLEAVLPSYFKFWAKEDFGQLQWVGLEKEFDIEFAGFRLRGKMDGIYRKGGLWVFETKTKGRIDEQNISELLSFDFQSDFYSLATEKLYKEPPVGIRYNIIRRPGQKLGKKETVVAFKERVRKEVLADPKHYFIRYRVDKSKEDMEVFKRELTQILKEYKEWQQGKIADFKNPTSCVDKYGTCRFLRICSSKNYAGFYKREHMFAELSNKKKGE